MSVSRTCVSAPYAVERRPARKKPAMSAKTKNMDSVATIIAPAERTGKQGWLSVLPTLPMDLLY